MPTIVSKGFFEQQGNPIYSYTTFSGADMVASIGNKVFGNLQAIQYSVQREIAPVYVMGASLPLAYTRGKRAITGSLVFINFDKDALIAHFGGQFEGQQESVLWKPPLQPDKWGVDVLARALGSAQPSREKASLRYADQVPPFDITISLLNEMGDSAHMRIEGVQLINEGMGMSIDDVVLEKAITFIARTLRPLVSKLAGQQTSTPAAGSTG